MYFVRSIVLGCMSTLFFPSRPFVVSYQRLGLHGCVYEYVSTDHIVYEYTYICTVAVKGAWDVTYYITLPGRGS